SAPAIIFIDEIDAVGRRRGTSAAVHANEEREQTLNQLLVEMDGFSPREDILVMAATNRRDILDPALLRAGRFDRCISIPLPDPRSREEIFRRHLGARQTSPAVWDDSLMYHFRLLTEGCSGADIATIVNEASMQAVFQNHTRVKPEHVMHALDRHHIGIRKQRDERSVDTLRQVAIHELGHALAVNMSSFFRVEKINIHPTYQGVGGITWFLPSNRSSSSVGMMTRQECMDRLCILLGGKAAEHVFYGQEGWTTGATHDLEKAHDWIHEMIHRLGMSSKLPHYHSGGSLSPTMVSDHRRKVWEDNERQWIHEMYDRIFRHIQKHRVLIEQRLLPRLLQNKELSRDEWEALLHGQDSGDKK
ncbi:MAG: AAA family ATPase, partial [Planctomycetes bacterium]|nr:AAA family ATPase [Planctomycetota bacterium]